MKEVEPEIVFGNMSL